MILIPTLDGHEFSLYEKLDAQAYLGGISANTRARWRREGWLVASASIGRGYAYTKDALDECRLLKNLDARNKEVEYA